ncbi:L,D-transpeptidase family protein [Algoriphagus sp.]|uniref:L,D-transpeptidase family protein n=1 Tax=Algoriphagus sp. TaxID=1872435 RepID=UPI0026224E74|nr:L,D-transpeptidase family protein [Algoriphagus sp.]
MRFLFLLAVFQWGIATLGMTQGQGERIKWALAQQGKQLNPAEQAELFEFYQKREFKPIWLVDGFPNRQALAYQEILSQIHYEGLDPEDYQFSRISLLYSQFSSRNSVPFTPELDEWEVLLTTSFYRLVNHLYYGKIDPEPLPGIWKVYKKKKPQVAIHFLTRLPMDPNLTRIFGELRPPDARYWSGVELMKQLQEEMKDFPSGFNEISFSQTLELGEKSIHLPLIRERLAQLGYSSGNDSGSDPTEFDSITWLAIKKLQKENRLEPDGVIGKNTLAVLNASPTSKMDQISVNLERMRWMPQEFWEGKRIVVNVADFQMSYLDDADTLFTSEIIVGTVKNQTPIFSAELDHLVFSPYWNVPLSIIQNELIPAIRRNPDYLARNKMEVTSHAGKVIHPSSVHWDLRPFPYLIRQKPGPHNSLGLVKFMFPNPYQVYLHDTPAKQLFFKASRAFSHGCIRMKKPQEFAEILLKDNPNWTIQKIREAMTRDQETQVDLNEKIPVWVLYFTFWMDEKGQPKFIQDVYGLDREVLRLLNK